MAPDSANTRSPCTVTFRLGPLRVRVEGEHVVTRWAREVYAPLAEVGESPGADLVFRFVDALAPLAGPETVGDDDVRVASGAMQYHERCFNVAVTAGQPLRIELAQRDHRPRWLRALSDPEEAWKMWLSHGTSLDTHLLKEFAYTIAPLALHAALLERQAALVHAGCVAVGAGAVLFPAWGGVGKSTVVSRAVMRGRGSFLADDHAVIDAAGLAHPHLLPMHVYHYHMASDPELRRRVLASCSVVNGLQWRCAARLRPRRVVRWVSPAAVFGAANIGAAARIEEVILMFRGNGDAFVWEELSAADAARPCTGVWFEEVNAMPQRLALAGAGWAPGPLPDLPTAVRQTQDLYTRAWSNARCARLLVPHRAAAADLLDFLRRHSPLLDEALAG